MMKKPYTWLIMIMVMLILIEFYQLWRNWNG